MQCGWHALTIIWICHRLLIVSAFASVSKQLSVFALDSLDIRNGLKLRAMIDKPNELRVDPSIFDATSGFSSTFCGRSPKSLPHVCTFLRVLMFSTLQAALGVWPSEAGFPASVDQETPLPRPSGVNERFSFESEHSSPVSAASVFTITPENFPSGRVFVPPFFVPPGSSGKEVLLKNKLSVQKKWAALASTGSRETAAEPVHNHQNAHPYDSNGAQPDRELHDRSSPLRDSVTFNAATRKRPIHAIDSSLPHHARSMSPPSLSTDEQEERDSVWSSDSRKAFHAMVTAPGYVNRYRLPLKRRQRMIHYLEHPELEPMNCDGSKDHQTKYQAANWIVIGGKLYRKADSGRVGKLRKHLDEFEVWDVLTMEHLRSGHLGRDKLRKVLEQRYIGYTLQEIMFVLKDCKKCARKEGKHSTEEAPKAGNGSVADLTQREDEHYTGTSNTALTKRSSLDASLARGPFGRKQTSNMMWF